MITNEEGFQADSQPQQTLHWYVQFIDYNVGGRQETLCDWPGGENKGGRE